MTKYGIIKLSRAAAIEACCQGSMVFQLDLSNVEIYEIRYMVLADILDNETNHIVIYFEIVPDEDK